MNIPFLLIKIIVFIKINSCSTVFIKQCYHEIFVCANFYAKLKLNPSIRIIFLARLLVMNSARDPKSKVSKQQNLKNEFIL